jgi:hypothetical protein
LRIQPTRSCTIVGLGLLALACSMPIHHDYDMSPDQAFNGSATHALLIPINETETVPDGLEVGEKNVFSELKAYLESKGLSVETTTPYAYRLAANKATEDAQNRMQTVATSSISGEISYSSIVPGLLAHLQSNADLLIVSNMVIRTGRSDKGRTTAWDGVKRRIDVPSRWKFTGSEPVASVFVSVYEKNGTNVFSGYGGLDLLFAPNIREEKYELIPDRLQNIDDIREGVCVAFYPYFGTEESCR